MTRRTFVKLEGEKVFARVNSEDSWTHVETISFPVLAEGFADDLEADPVSRAEYVSDPLS